MPVIKTDPNERPTVKPPPVHIPTAKSSPKPKSVPLPPLLAPSRITPQTTARLMVKPPPVIPKTARAEPAHKVSARETYKPQYPGQPVKRTVTHINAARQHTRVPVYELGKAGPVGSDEAQLNAAALGRAAHIRQQNIGTPGVIFRDTATSLVPKTFVDVGAGKPLHVGTVGKDILNAVSWVNPSGALAATALGVGLKGTRAAKIFATAVHDGETVKTAATAASKVAKDVTYTRALAKTRETIAPELAASQSRAAEHALIDQQMAGESPAKIARVKANLDHAAVVHAADAAKAGDGNAIRHATEFYDTLHASSLHPHGLGERFVVPAKQVVDEIVAHGVGKNASMLPPLARNKAGLTGLIQTLDSRLRAGMVVGKDWYRASGKAILRYAGGDLQTADKLAALTAIYSPQQAVVPNIGLALRALEQARLGQAVSVGQKWQKVAAQRVIDGLDWRAGMSADQGLKIRSFYGNLLKHIDPQLLAEKGYTGREVTADGWIGAAFGYGHNTNTVSLTPKQYKFMERTIQTLADHYGIEPEEAQAAIWMSIKAERDVSTRALFLKDPQAAIMASGQNFEDGLIRDVHNVRFGFEGASPHKPWQAGLTPEKATAYQGEVSASVADALHQEGMPARITDEGTSFYVNEKGVLETNPGSALELPIGGRLTMGAGGKSDKAVFQAVAPEQQAFYDGLAAAIAKGLQQESGGWLRPLVSKANLDHTAWRIHAGAQLDEAQMAALGAALDTERFYASPTVDGLLIVSTNPDAHLALAGAERATSASDASAHVLAALDQTLGPDAVQGLLADGKIQGFTHRGGYVDQSTYSDSIRLSGRSDLLGRVADRIAASVAGIDSRYSAELAAGADHGHSPGVPGLDVAHPADALAAPQSPQVAGLDVPHPDDAVPEGAPSLDPGYLASEERANAETAAWQQGIIDDLAGGRGSQSFGELDLSRGKGLDAPYKARTGRSGDLTAQYQKPRSAIAAGVLRMTDRISPALDRSAWVHDMPGVRLLTSSDRVAKFAGRSQRFEKDRRLAEMAHEVQVIGKVKEGSRKDVAHFWYAQLPASHRNAEGLKLIQGKQEEELYYISSGQAEKDLAAREAAIKATMREAEQGDHFPLMRDLEETKILREDLPHRIPDITASIGVLEHLVEAPPEVDQSVLDAMQKLASDRERILIASGRLKEEVSANRPGIVSDWLGLEPDGSEIYVGHRLPRPERSPALTTPSGGTGRVRSPSGVGTRNNLVLAKNGRLRASTRVSFQDWQMAQVFDQANKSREDLWAAGTPWSGGSLKPGMALVNRKGRTVPAFWKTDELAQYDEHAVDRAQIRQHATDILEGFLARTPDEAATMASLADEAGQPVGDLRVVPQRFVDRYYSQFRSMKGRGTPLKAYDMAIDAISTSIVFFRVGYIPKNLVQNAIMSIPHQGALIPFNAVRAAQVLHDPELKALITSEMGGGATAGLGRERTIKKGFNKITEKVTAIADDPIRVSAWLHEAALEGVIPRLKPLLGPEDRKALMTFLSDKRHRARLNDVSGRGKDAMADFTRMTPDQARAVRRILIVPGWLMAGSRYPFHFALTHPVRSALLAYALMGEPGAPNELQFNQPITHYFKGNKYLVGIDTRWGRIRTSSLNPVSTPWDLAQAGYGSVRGKSGAFDYNTPTVFDEANPLIKLIAAGVQGDLKGASGWEKQALSLVPDYSFIHGMVDPKASPRYPDDASRLGRLERELGVVPIHVNDTIARKARARRASSRSSGPPGSGRSSGAPGSGSGGLAPGSGSAP